MKACWGSLMIGSVLLGLGMSGSVVGQASSYSAKRSNSVRLVWRHSMGRHAYHTVKGARYSRHLGTKYSTNDDLPNVTWYTDAHEKLYRKAKHSSAIYYHVKSADGQRGGWIWRGYLTPGLAPASGADTAESEKPIEPKVALFSAKDSAEYQHAIETQDYYALAKNVWAMFPGTKINLWLSQLTAYELGMDDDPKQAIESYKIEGLMEPQKIEKFDLGYDWKAFQDTEGQSMMKRTDWLAKKMDEKGLTKKKRESFQGWYIGVNFVDDEKDLSNINYSTNKDSDEHPLHYELIIVPPINSQKLDGH